MIDPRLLFSRSLIRGGPRNVPVSSDTLASLDVDLGRGAVTHIRQHGGLLFLWGEPFGSGFYKLVAGQDAPAGLDFVRSTATSEFELYLQAGLQLGMPIRLTRRWFGLRDGIVAVSGRVVVGGG